MVSLVNDDSDVFTEDGPFVDEEEASPDNGPTDDELDDDEEGEYDDEWPEDEAQLV